MERKRGVALTICAILFCLLAVSNFMKMIYHLHWFQSLMRSPMQPGVGFVFLGTKLTGVANMIMGPLFGIILASYAYGIWAMRKFALPIAYFYAAYVILNLALFTAKSHGSGFGNAIGLILYPLIAIGVSSGAALVLHLRRAELT